MALVEQLSLHCFTIICDSLRSAEVMLSITTLSPTVEIDYSNEQKRIINGSCEPYQIPPLALALDCESFLCRLCYISFLFSRHSLSNRLWNHIPCCTQTIEQGILHP